MKKSKGVTLAGFAALVLITMVAYGCGGGGGGGDNTTPPGSSSSVQIVSCGTGTTTDVLMSGNTFILSAITINTNDVVKWTNSDTVTHSVTSGTPGSPDGKFESGNMSQNAVVCMKFLVAGTYPYYCRFHPSIMTGSVTVP